MIESGSRWAAILASFRRPLIALDVSERALSGGPLPSAVRPFFSVHSPGRSPLFLFGLFLPLSALRRGHSARATDSVKKPFRASFSGVEMQMENSWGEEEGRRNKGKEGQDCTRKRADSYSQ